MKIEPISNDSLRVWLADEEIKQWDLDATEPNRRRIRRLVRQVLASVGWETGGSLSAEMIPVEGGCVLLIRPMAFPWAHQPSVYHLPDGDALLDWIRQWRYIYDEPQPHISLYAGEEGYDLAVYPDIPLSRRQQHLLLEYGYLIGYGEGAVAHCAEYGTLLEVGWQITAREPAPPERRDLPH